MAFSAILQAQPPEVLSAQKINRLLPSKIHGFHLVGESRSRQMKLGGLTYSLCERNFANRDKVIKILLFDYVDAPVMYEQALKNWSEVSLVESDTIVFREVRMPNTVGWEMQNMRAHESQFMLGINSRFFLTLSGRGVELFELTKILQQIDPDKFPK